MFTSWSSLSEIRVDKQGIVLCHYAMKVWPHHSRGTWQLYGRSHGNLPDDPLSLSMDVGVDSHDRTPQPQLPLGGGRFPRLACLRCSPANERAISYSTPSSIGSLGCGLAHKVGINLGRQQVKRSSSSPAPRVTRMANSRSKLVKTSEAMPNMPVTANTAASKPKTLRTTVATREGKQRGSEISGSRSGYRWVVRDRGRGVERTFRE